MSLSGSPPSLIEDPQGPAPAVLSGDAAVSVAGICSLTAVLLSVYQIGEHLVYYTEPEFQRYIIRIVFMVPVYAVLAFCSLNDAVNALKFDTIRDCYESWIIYNFLALCISYMGGPGAVVVNAEGTVVEPSWCTCTVCVLPRGGVPVNATFLRRCKQGVLQFVILKPILAILVLTLDAFDLYGDGELFAFNKGYPYMGVLVYNLSYTIALYSLLLFYLGTHELLAPFKPLMKFILIKSVIFLTFWQGLFITMCASVGTIHTPTDAKRIQNFLICLEMAMASVFMRIAFPAKEYNPTGQSANSTFTVHGNGLSSLDGNAAAGGGHDASSWMPGRSSVNRGIGRVQHALSLRDVMNDTVHQFAPQYHDYVLYDAGGGGMEEPSARDRSDTADGMDYATPESGPDSSGSGGFWTKFWGGTNGPSSHRGGRRKVLRLKTYTLKGMPTSLSGAMHGTDEYAREHGRGVAAATLSEEDDGVEETLMAVRDEGASVVAVEEEQPPPSPVVAVEEEQPPPPPPPPAASNV